MKKWPSDAGPLFIWLLAAKKPCEKAWLFWIVLVSLAALALWHAAKRLLYVLTAAGPGWLTALAAGNLRTHSVPF